MTELEFETSCELDDAKIFTLSRTRQRTSLSLFELDIEAPNEKLQKSEYEEALEREAREWNDLLKLKVSQIAEVEKKKVIIDKSILSSEQLAYIERCPDFSELVQESENFCEKALIYSIQGDEVVEMLRALQESYKNVLDHTAFDIIYRCLYTNQND